MRASASDQRLSIGDQADTAVIISLVDVTIYRNGAPMSADPLVLPAIPIANVFRDNPKFRSGAELRENRLPPAPASFWRDHPSDA